MKKLLLLLSLVTLAALAQTNSYIRHLQWDPNPPEENVTYYSVKWSSVSGGPYMTVTNVTTTNAIVYAKGGKNFWIVTASNSAGESDPSNEVFSHLTPSKVKNVR